MSPSPSGGPASAKRLTQILLGVAVLILLAGGAIVFLMNSQIAGLQTIASNKEAEVGSSEQVARRYQATLDTYNETLSHIQFLEASVTPKSYVPTLLKQLQALAETTHLTVMAVKPSPIQTASPATPAGTQSGSSASSSAASSSGADKKKALPYDTLDIAVDVSGTYANTVAFLYDLTRFPKIISVTSAQLSPGSAAEGGQSSPLVTTSLHLTAFIFHEDAPQAVPAPAAPGAGTGVAAAPAPVVPPPAAPTVAGAAGRAAQGAVAATRAAQARSQAGAGAL